jgi:two-component system chemotaxis response regulator CheB
LDYLSKDMRAWMEHSSSLEKQLRDKVVELGNSRQAKRSSIFSGSDSAGSSKSMVFRPETTSPARKPLSSKPGLTERTRSPEQRTAASLSSLRSRIPNAQSPSAGAVKPKSSGKKTIPAGCKVVVIGSSTGGPAALQQILTQLPANFPYPILLVQHMPKTFTSVFASRLDQQCNISVKEAEDGDQLIPGRALLAPGGHQMIIDPRGQDRVKIMPGDERLTYKPSVDVTYASAAKSYGKNVLAIILTGMGADGCDGAKLLRQKGAAIWAQNKESSTIYGMPQAVVNAGLADAILDLTEFGPLLSNRRMS